MMSLKLRKAVFSRRNKRIKTFDEKDNYHNIFALLFFFDWYNAYLSITTEIYLFTCLVLF